MGYDTLEVVTTDMGVWLDKMFKSLNHCAKSIKEGYQILRMIKKKI